MQMSCKALVAVLLMSVLLLVAAGDFSDVGHNRDQRTLATHEQPTGIRTHAGASLGLGNLRQAAKSRRLNPILTAADIHWDPGLFAVIFRPGADVDGSIPESPYRASIDVFDGSGSCGSSAASNSNEGRRFAWPGKRTDRYAA